MCHYLHAEETRRKKTEKKREKNRVAKEGECRKLRMRKKHFEEQHKKDSETDWRQEYEEVSMGYWWP